jgi:hypothetical protein
MAMRSRLQTFEAVCVSLFANLHRMGQHVVRSLLLSRINEDAPLALKDLAAAVWIVREQAILKL